MLEVFFGEGGKTLSIGEKNKISLEEIHKSNALSYREQVWEVQFPSVSRKFFAIHRSAQSSVDSYPPSLPHLSRNGSSATGEAALPLDARVVGVSHPVLLSVKDKQGRNRGFLRVETFWLDEAKPRKDTGEFYYKVGRVQSVSSMVMCATSSQVQTHQDEGV